MSDVNEVLTLTQIKKLKVAELRERLQKLDKPTTGLKPDLVKRLFDALFEAQKKQITESTAPLEQNQSIASYDTVSQSTHSVSAEEAVEPGESEPTRDDQPPILAVEEPPENVSCCSEKTEVSQTEDISKEEDSKDIESSQSGDDLVKEPQAVDISENISERSEEMSQSSEGNFISKTDFISKEEQQTVEQLVEPLKSGDISARDESSADVCSFADEKKGEKPFEESSRSSDSSMPRHVEEANAVESLPNESQIDEDQRIVENTTDSIERPVESVSSEMSISEVSDLPKEDDTQPSISENITESSPIDTSIVSSELPIQNKETKQPCEEQKSAEPILESVHEKDEPFREDDAPESKKLKLEDSSVDSLTKRNDTSSINKESMADNEESLVAKTGQETEEKKAQLEQIEQKASITVNQTSDSSRKELQITKSQSQPPKERKRRWGSSLNSSSSSGSSLSQTAKGISSESIKELIPDLNKTNSQVSNKTDDTKKDSKITPTNTTLQISTNVSGIGQSNSGTAVNHGMNGITGRIGTGAAKSLDKRDVRIFQKSNSVSEETVKPQEEKEEPRRSSLTGVSTTKEIDTNLQPKSPARNPQSNIIFIRDLVRPFTLLQLKELLGKNGKIVEEKFWIDKIKSKCYVAYETEDQAVTTRNALHGIRWPDANPKTLIVDYANEEELQYHLNLEKTGPGTANVPEAPKSDTRRQEVKTAKDKYDVIIKRERNDEKETSANKNDDRKDTRKEKKDEIKEKEKRPIREWDREKFLRKSDGGSVSPVKKRRSQSRSVSPRKEGDLKSKERDKHTRDAKPEDKQKEKTQENDSPANLLDDLFKKTKATPCIYWLPLNEEQAKKREEERNEAEKRRNEERIAREAERRKRMEEINRNRRPSPPYPRRGAGIEVTVFQDQARGREADRGHDPEVVQYLGPEAGLDLHHREGVVLRDVVELEVKVRDVLLEDVDED
ncbi:hypothetical protein B4U79_02084, partial [Dinothrombium tinctorium]